MERARLARIEEENKKLREEKERERKKKEEELERKRFFLNSFDMWGLL